MTKRDQSMPKDGKALYEKMLWDIARNKAKVNKWRLEREPLSQDDHFKYIDKMDNAWIMEDSLKTAYIDGYEKSLQERGFSEGEIQHLVLKEEKLLKIQGELREAVELKKIGVPDDKIKIILKSLSDQEIENVEEIVGLLNL